MGGNMKAFLVILLAFSLVSVCGGYKLPASQVYGELSMVNHKITDLAAPSEDTDAATKAYADSVAVGGGLPITGGEMKGQIDVGGFTVVNSTTPTNDTDLATKDYVDSNSGSGLPITGGEMKGQIDVGGFTVVNSTTPTNDTDLATKDYVDSNSGSGLPTTGGTMSGQIDFGGFTAYNSTVPVNDTDLSTKLYADYRASWVNVKEYGAKGDNSTDDTAAFNAAIAVANSAALSVYYMYSKNTNTLYIPDGEYNITPGALSEIRCNVYGPGASLHAHTTANDTLLRIGNTGFNTVILAGLRGYYVPTDGATLFSLLQTDGFKGVGLDISDVRAVYNNVQINSIQNFFAGVNIGNTSSSIHVASNNFLINTIQNCRYGILGQAHTLGLEDNRFSINYFQNCNRSIYLDSPAAYSGCILDNIFDVQVIEQFNGSQYGIYLRGDGTTKNQIRLQRIMTHSNVAHDIICDDSAADNNFDIQWYNSALKLSIKNNTLTTAPNDLIYIRVDNTAGTTMIGSTATKIPYATETSDVWGLWDGDTFTANSDGLYFVEGLVTTNVYAQVYNNYISIYAIKNDTAADTIGVYTESYTTMIAGIPIQDVLYLQAGDTYEVFFNKEHAGNVALSGGPGTNWLTITKIG